MRFAVHEVRSYGASHGNVLKHEDMKKHYTRQDTEENCTRSRILYDMTRLKPYSICDLQLVALD